MSELVISFLPTHLREPEPAASDTQDDGSGEQRPFVVLVQGVPLEPEVTSAGEHRYEIGDHVQRSEVSLLWRGTEQPLSPGLWDELRAPGGRAVVVVPSLSPVDVPYLSKFEGRLKRDTVNELPPPVVAGYPDPNASEDAWKLPITALPIKQVVNLLAPVKQLMPDDDWAHGYLHELEANWEPLGWALDEWISTISLGPYEDTMTADGWVSGNSRIQEDSQAQAHDETNTSQSGNATATEAVNIAARQKGRQTGFSAGLGHSISTSASLTVANPIATLAEAVTGAVQLGFTTSSIDASSTSQGDLRREVVNAVDSSTRLDRERHAAAFAQSAGSFTNSRQLRALRNLAGSRTLNLALFTVVRHWLVTTLESRIRPVLFIRADKLGEPFTQEDVFLHREVLSGVLLDTSLRKALNEAASSYEPAQDHAVVVPILKAATITATVLDEAEGRGSSIEVAALVRDPSGHVRAISLPVTGVKRGQQFTRKLQIEKPLDRLAGWRFTFDNPGRWNSDHDAIIEHVEATLEIERDGQTEPLPVGLGNRLVLRANVAKTVDSELPKMHSNDDTEVDPSLRRLLAHLEANRSYYRIAIDLVADPSQRFANLAKRAGALPMPADMQPVGITGNHLAFVAKKDGNLPPDTLLDKPIRQLAATPAGGTFMEAMGGGKISTAVTATTPLPSVALPKDVPVAWPELLAPASLERSANEQLADKDVKGPDSPQPGDSQLATQLSSAREDLAKVAETLKGIQEQVDKVIPKTEAKAPDPTKPADDGKNSTSEGGTLT